MKFKMTNEQINKIHQLLKSNGDSLTNVGVVVSNICCVAKTVKMIKNHKDLKEES